MYIIGPSFEKDDNGPYANIMQFKCVCMYLRLHLGMILKICRSILD